MKTILAYLLPIIFSANLFAQHAVTIDVEHSVKVEEAVNVSLPKRVAWVNDFEKLLNEDEWKKLNTDIENFNAASGYSVAVVTVTDLNGHTSADSYAGTLGKAWGIWTQNNPNGIVILFSKSLKQIAFSRAEELEGTFTQEACIEIMTKKMLPNFQKGNYYEGFNAAFKQAKVIWMAK